MSIATRHQINALTSTRAIAAIMVVIHHYGGTAFPFNLAQNIFHSGNVAVSYFFVLSGFVLYVAHEGRSIDYLDYLKRRVARIFPLYYLALLFTVLVLLQEPPLPADFGKQIIYSIFFIQSYLPGYPMCLNSPAWSISIEMFFYLLFPVLLALQQRRMNIFAILFFGLFVSSQWIHLKYFPQRYGLSDNILDPVFFSPLIHISQFMIGMLGGYLFKRPEYYPFKAGYFPILVFLLILVLLAIRPDNISYHVGMLAPLFVVLIIGVARGRMVVLNLPFFIFLGEISYGVYILQFPLFRYLKILNKSYAFGPSVFFYVSIALLLVAAAILHYVVERPLRKWINGEAKVVKPI